MVYRVAGGLFVAGSVLFLPAFASYADVGTSLFLVGSLLYAAMSAGDAVAHRLWREGCFFAGALLFIVGSACFYSFVMLERWGGWCFLAGSLLFVVSAALELRAVPGDMPAAARRESSFAAIAFLVGSALFAIASLPYLWMVGDGPSAAGVLVAVAWLFIVGSLLFLAGGVLQDRRILSGAR